MEVHGFFTPVGELAASVSPFTAKVWPSQADIKTSPQSHVPRKQGRDQPMSCYSQPAHVLPLWFVQWLCMDTQTAGLCRWRHTCVLMISHIHDHTTTFGQTPKGRLPYIKHGDDQVSTDDSSSALCLQFSDAVMKSDAAMDMSSGHDPAGWRQPIHH